MQNHEVLQRVLHCRADCVYNKLICYYDVKGGDGMVHGLISVFARLGSCGGDVLRLIPRFLMFLLRVIFRGLRDILYLVWLMLRSVGSGIRDFVLARRDTAESVRTELRQARTGTGFARLRSGIRMLRLLFVSDHGILATLMRFAVPVTCCVLLWTVVSYGAHLEYCVAVTVNGQPLGIVAAESDYIDAEEIVYRRLSYSSEDYDVTFSRSLELKIYDGSEMLMTSGELANQILQHADVELAEGIGVYVNDEFLGAVTDTHPIEAALARQLSLYSDQLGGEVEEIYYADTVTYEEGIYLAESVVNAQQLANKMTHTEHTTRTYTAGKSDTIYAVAEKFSVPVDELRALNPDVPDMIPAAWRMTVPVVSRFLPIVYTKTAMVVSAVPYRTVEIETDELRQGAEEILTPGVLGEKEQKIQFTYTDGVETGRRVLTSRMEVIPVTEEIGIGIYSAQPYSTDTVIDGNGRYGWPVDGGRISDVFGGERAHRGIDIAAAQYSEIYAAASGVVRVAGWNDSYGNYAIIDHGDGYETLYAHCEELLVQPEQTVRRGQVVALVGTTGHSTGYHLHFEVRYNGVNENPALYLRVNAD